MRKRMLVQLAVASFLLVGVTAFGNDALPIERLVIAQAADPSTLDPHLHGERHTHIIADNIFDPLVRRGPNNELINWLAKSVEQVDELTWRIEVRQGVRFHNGNEFNASSVKYSLDRRRSDIAPDAHEWANVADIEIVDDYTVLMHLTAPIPVVPNQLYFNVMVDPEYMESNSAEAIARNPVGTGPFRFVSWEPDVELVLAANDDYWAGTPAVRKLVFRPIREASTRVAAVETGEVDIAASIPPSFWSTIEALPDVRLESSIGGRLVFVGLNLVGESSPLDDPRVRHALNYAVDKELINEAFLDGMGEVSGQPSGSQIFGYNPDIAPYPYDPTRARELLSDAGYPAGFTIQFDVPATDVLNGVSVAEAITAQLGEVGIDVQLNVLEDATFYDRMFEGSIGHMYLLSWGGANVYDAWNYLRPLLTEDSVWSTYSPGSEFLELLSSAGAASNDDERLGYYHELMALAHDEAPWIFLYIQPNVYAVNEAYNWRARPDEMIPARYVQLGDIDPQELVDEELRSLTE